MRSPFILLRIIGKCLVRYVTNAELTLADDFGELLPAVAGDIWGAWSKQSEPQQQEEELRGLALTPVAQLRRTVSKVVEEVGANQSTPVQQRLATYLTQVPAMIRQTLRRPSDPLGVTIPTYLKLTKPEDLLQFLPGRLPRFNPGDHPMPGVDLELVELLGVGGFSEVWKAVNPHLPSAEPVALKFCLDPQAAKMLRHEAAVLDRVMRQGKHPGIVQLRHTYLSADPPCLEYEFVPGGDLGSLIQEWHHARKGPSPTEAGKLMVRLAETVGFAHSQSPPIVHRDLKPANILVQRTADKKIRFRIADFGIGGVASGRSVEQTQRSNLPSGMMQTMLRGAYTPLYASPQQMQGDAPDPRDDVYSLGVVWYQLLTGNLQLGAPSGMQWAERLKQQNVLESHIALLASCFEPHRKDRPSSAGVLAKQMKTTLQECMIDKLDGSSAVPVEVFPVDRPDEFTVGPAGVLTDEKGSSSKKVRVLQESDLVKPDEFTVGPAYVFPDESEPSSQKLRVFRWIGFAVVGLLMLLCGGVILILNRKQPAETITLVDLSPAIQAKDIRIVSWERTTGAGGVQSWVTVYMTSTQGYNPSTPDGRVREYGHEIVFTLYDRHDTKIYEETGGYWLPWIRAGEKVRMLLFSGEMPRAKRIVIHLTNE